MRCTSPRTVGFLSDGKTISWSPKHYSKEYATFQLPCGKCVECRLEYAHQWAIRCVHESQMHPNNCFITLTYSDQNLKSPKLIYEDFQKFMRRLRKTQNEPIGMFVTGEYGEKTKRPHWHAIIFNWQPTDGIYKYSNDRKDKIFESKNLNKLWGNGIAEYGSVTIHSAGYCARYSLKKIVHGENGKVAEADYHDFQPISKKSSKHAIGKKFLEKFYKDIFSEGKVLIKTGNEVTQSPIPRYYEKWLQKHHPDYWERYVTERKADKILLSSERANELLSAERRTNAARALQRKGHARSQREAKKIIQKQKTKMLQAYLKL